MNIDCSVSMACVNRKRESTVLGWGRVTVAWVEVSTNIGEFYIVWRVVSGHFVEQFSRLAVVIMSVIS